MSTFVNLFSGGQIFLLSIFGGLSWRLRFQKDDGKLCPETRARLESKTQELAKKLGINKCIEIIEKKGMLTPMQAQGVALFSSRVGIAVDPKKINSMSEDEWEFPLAHELAHIQANDVMWMGIVPEIIGAITTLAMRKIFPFPSLTKTLLIGGFSRAASTGLVVSTIVFCFFSRWREECADKRGWSICSDNGQKKSHKFFKPMQKTNIDLRNDDSYLDGPVGFILKLFIKLSFTKAGDDRLDNFLHPPLSTRIQYLKEMRTAKFGPKDRIKTSA